MHQYSLRFDQIWFLGTHTFVLLGLIDMDRSVRTRLVMMLVPKDEDVEKV